MKKFSALIVMATITWLAGVDTPAALGAIPLSREGALEDLKAKAESGDSEALYELAIHDAILPRVQHDCDNALKLLRKASSLGHPKAKVMLEALESYNEALKDCMATQEKPASQFGLGVLYNSPFCDGQDLIEAQKWFLLAASHGYIDPESRISARQWAERLGNTLTIPQSQEVEKRLATWRRDHPSSRH
jgi:TPR repeat protein